MNKEQENQFKENIKKIARLELKNSFNDNLMETLNSAFIFKYVYTLEKQNKKYKEVIDKIKECINDFPVIHYSSIEKVDNKRLSGKLIPIDDLLDILKEVE